MSKELTPAEAMKRTRPLIDRDSARTCVKCGNEFVTVFLIEKFTGHNHGARQYCPECQKFA